MIKLIVISIAAVILLDIIKQSKPEFLSVLLLSVGVVLVSILLPEFKKIQFSIEDMLNIVTLPDRLFDDLVKITIGGYICKMVCDYCDDCGYKSISDKVELACRIYVSAITVNWIYKLIVNINKLL